MNELIPRVGNYKKLLSYQKTDVIYQITYFFCSHFLTKGDRTVDQMIQAARSGKQNIIEGCAASATSHNDVSYFKNIIATRPPETIANMAIILINQADYLLFRQLKRLEKDFIEKGGFSERMTQLRRNQRGF